MLSKFKFRLVKPELSIEYIKPIKGRLYAFYCWLKMAGFYIGRFKLLGEEYYVIVLVLPKFNRSD